MGVDLLSITGHDFSTSEVLCFQEAIECDKILKDIRWWNTIQ